jgi:Tol biopolymer transport system component
LALTPGSRLGVYEIVTPIGEGGMGQVYRATDTLLGRQVAIKILPDAFAADPDRMARFEREARTLASLNHPNIAAIYGFEKSTGLHALVMELIEGEDVSQRIARGAIPVDEALPIAKQIAEALEAAHEQGIIHRDLKPANIKVRPDGTVKVLDFGLAKALEPAAVLVPSMSVSPTITSPAMTQAGMILGTASYMSPEQARGKLVDRRADIWAFGVVLFEMLTGRRAFDGEDMTEVLGAVVRLEPNFDALPRDVPQRIRRVLEVCLRKDLRQRAQAMGDVRLALAGAFETTAPGPAAAVSTSPSRGRGAAMAAVAALLIASGLAVPAVRRLREAPPAAPAETRLEIVTPEADQPSSFALSPDGRQIIFAATSVGTSRLWLRSLASTTAQPLAGTEGATNPFWSPDGRSVGFFANGQLMRLDFGGSAPRALAPVTAGSGGTWSADGVILFAPNRTTRLMRMAASGGEAVAVTSLEPQQQGHAWPVFLPDGRRFLFFALGAADVSGIYLGALDGSAPVKLTPGSFAAGIYVPPGVNPGDGRWLVWTQGQSNGTLSAQRLDIDRKALTGEPVVLADRVVGSSASVAGVIAYRTGSNLRQLVWFDRTGAQRGTLGEPDTSNLTQPRVSHDGQRIVVARNMQANQDLWLLNGDRTTRLTNVPSQERFPVWSPDGSKIVFYSNRTGPGDLYVTLASGGSSEERIVASDQFKWATDWSPDGRYLLYNSIDPQSNADLWLLPMAGDRTPSVFLKTPFRETYGAFSPDGRWVAYASTESGRPEIYIRPFVPPGAAGTVRPSSGNPETTGQWQVSTAGGIHPRWRADGKEVYYINPAGAMMAAPIAVTGATLTAGAPVVLFPTHIYGGGIDNQQGPQYDVAPDGRFLINTELNTATSPITLIQNWQPETKK